MKTKATNPEQLGREIEAAEEKLEGLEKEIAGIGEPASRALQERLDHLKVEERALLRNFAEFRTAGAGSTAKRRKIETLLHHIESEETALEHEADYLHQAAPTTIEFALKGGAYVFDLGTRGWRKAKGDRQWMWHSPFVNHTYEHLAARFHVSPPKD